MANLTVKLGAAALHESAALKSQARNLRSLRLVVVAVNTKGRRTTIDVPITKL